MTTNDDISADVCEGIAAASLKLASNEQIGDYTIPCPLCHAAIYERCATDTGLCHLERRIKRLLLEKGLMDLE